MRFPLRSAALFLVYGGAVSLVVALKAHSHALPPSAAAAFLSTLWLGFVLAVSFTQPLVDDDFGCSRMDDNGDGVVSATNAIEAAFASGLLAVYTSTPLDKGSGVLTGLLVVFGVQALLFHAANIVIQGGLKSSSMSQPDELAIHRRWRADEQSWWLNQLILVHVAYMVAEVAKLALLIVLVVALLSNLSA